MFGHFTTLCMKGLVESFIFCAVFEASRWIKTNKTTPLVICLHMFTDICLHCVMDHYIILRVLATVKNSTVNAVFRNWPMIEFRNLVSQILNRVKKCKNR